ncbi:MAG: TonB-dependent receptor, partial [Gemmatimonadetes bacterium]|nr:TonB-dependent receptor [Gemmatimonadota bacterium]
DNDGGVKNDGEKQLALRANTRMRPHENLLIQFNSSLTTTELSNVPLGNTVESLVLTANRGDQSYVSTRSGDALNTLVKQRNFTDTNRFVSGVTFSFTPSTSFTHRLTLGYDYSQFEGRQVFPYAWRNQFGGGRYQDLGSIDRISNQNILTSVDYVGTLGFALKSNLASTLSWGFQGLENQEETVYASGDDFPGPGEYTIRSTARREGYQDQLKVITGGFFVQEMLALADKYFLTLGLRVDGNSAFGSGLGLQPYPKVSMSYVLSDESFWPESLGGMKLRAAYGLAGRAPGAFDAVRTWNPVGWGETQAAFQPGNLGNPQLGPERTSELELGFDATFLSQRLSADFTYYSRTTSDALFRVNRPATEGGWSSQLENVGEISNSGIELSLNGAVLDMASFRWELGAGISTNKSEVISLGGAPPFSVDDGGWIIEGQPAPVIRGWKVENFWEKADPVITRNYLFGPNYPPRIIHVNTAFTLLGGITLSGRGEYQGGAFARSQLEGATMRRTIPFAHCFDAYRRVDPSWKLGPPGSELGVPAGSGADLYAWERAHCFGMASSDLEVRPLDYFELRDITLNVPVSSLLPSLTRWARRADLTVSWRNVWYTTNRELMVGHPEMNETDRRPGGGAHELVKAIQESLPPASYFTISLRTVF